METTKNERKLLEAASRATTHKATLSLVGLVLGVIGGSMLIIYGLLQLLGIISKEQDALPAISFGSLMLGFFGVMYEHAQFKRTALLLIKKLTSQGKQVHP